MLSLRFFFASPELREVHRHSVLMSMWVKSCLIDNGLKVDDFVGVLSDSGNDVKRCCQLIGCRLHLLNRALVDALGWTETSTAEDCGGQAGREGGREVK